MTSKREPPGYISAAHLRAIQRQMLHELGRLTPEDFRRELENQGAIAELKRCGFWRDHQQSVPSSEARGFTFADLWRFYCLYCPAPPSVRAESERMHGAADIERAAASLRNAVASLQRMRKLGFHPPWIVDLAVDFSAEEKEAREVTVPRTHVNEAPRPLIVGDIEEALETYARELVAAAEAISRSGKPGPKARPSQHAFMKRWFDFAMAHAGSPLDEIGRCMLAIVYGRDLETGTYTRERHAAGIAARTREGKVVRSSRKNSQQKHANSSGRIRQAKARTRQR